MSSSPTTTILAVLAFLVAFYTLLARERKTPYITNFLFPPASLLVGALVLQLFSQLIQPATTTSVSTSRLASFIQRISHALALGAVLLFLWGIVWVAKNIWRLHNRQVHFRDDNLFKNIGIVRKCRNGYRKLKGKPTYAHDPQAADQDQLLSILSAQGFQVLKGSQPKTLAVCGEPLYSTDALIFPMVQSFLRQGWDVQYTTCGRHPVEWVEGLVRTLGDEHTRYISQIAVVDGYTPHFGFTDSIHALKSDRIKEIGITYVATSESYAGVHTATAKAFNTFKSLAQNEKRKPSFLVYESCRALADLDSPEQYRIFLRHVITSERMWGSMVTLFVEPEAEELDTALIAAYADCIRIRKDG